MTDITIPAVPAGLTLLVNFFAPYLVSLLINPTWSAKTKQLVGAAISVILTLGVLALAYYGFHEKLGANIALVILLGVVVLFAAYNTVHKEIADQLTEKAGVGTQKAALTPAATVDLSASAIPDDVTLPPDISSIGDGDSTASVTDDGTK